MPREKLIIGCGYLGRRVARAWLGRGDAVCALTRSPENARSLEQIGVRAILGDVTEPASLAGLPCAETVLYAVGYDRASGRTREEVGIAGLANVARRLGAVRRMLFVSSTGVYGQDAGEWVDEDSECRPRTPGGRMYLEAEQVLREPLPHANVLRLSGIYGPGRLVARVDALRAGEPLEGNPDAWLNLIHVDDAVASLLACERRGTPGATYIVSDDRPLPRREYYATLAWLVGAPEPRFGRFARESGEPGLNKRCSNRRLREALGVKLRYPTIAAGLPSALLHTAPV